MSIDDKLLTYVLIVLFLLFVNFLLILYQRKLKRRYLVVLEYLKEADERHLVSDLAGRYMSAVLFSTMARLHPHGLVRNCHGTRCFVDLPTGQVSWGVFGPYDKHVYYDTGGYPEWVTDTIVEAEIAEMFQGMEVYTKPDDGHNSATATRRMLDYKG